jgi:hypothetical protein
LAAELAATYPKVVAQLVDLFTRLKANDAELAGLHQARPVGTGLHLTAAELVARNLDGFTRAEPPIAEGSQLPDWANAAKMAWPPPPTPLGVLVAQGMAPAAHPGGDWWRVKDKKPKPTVNGKSARLPSRRPRRRENWQGPRWWEGERA